MSGGWNRILRQLQQVVASRISIPALLSIDHKHTLLEVPRKPRYRPDTDALSSAGLSGCQAPRRVRQPGRVVAFTDPLREAALSGGVSFFTTGIDSGFANDVLPLAKSGVSRTIDSIQCNRRLQRRAPSRWTLDAHSPAKGLDPVCEPDEP